MDTRFIKKIMIILICLVTIFQNCADTNCQRHSDCQDNEFCVRDNNMASPKSECKVINNKACQFDSDCASCEKLENSKFESDGKWVCFKNLCFEKWIFDISDNTIDHRYLECKDEITEGAPP